MIFDVVFSASFAGCKIKIAFHAYIMRLGCPYMFIAGTFAGEILLAPSAPMTNGVVFLESLGGCKIKPTSRAIIVRNRTFHMLVFGMMIFKSAFTRRTPWMKAGCPAVLFEGAERSAGLVAKSSFIFVVTVIVPAENIVAQVRHFLLWI